MICNAANVHKSIPVAVYGIVVVLSACLTTPSSMQAQDQRGIISVTVRTHEDSRVPGATVTARSSGTETRRIAVTDASGTAVLEALAPATNYVVTVSHDTLGGAQRTEVSVVAGQDTALVFSLYKPRVRYGWHIPERLLSDLRALARTEQEVASMEALREKLRCAPGADFRVDVDHERGLAPAVRTALGRLIIDATQAAVPDLRLAAGEQPRFISEYWRQLGVELVVVDLARKMAREKMELRLRLWVARDHATASRLLWQRSGGRGGDPVGQWVGLGDEDPESIREQRYWTSSTAHLSIILSEGDKMLGPDWVGLLIGNVLIEAQGNVFVRYPKSRKWFNAGLTGPKNGVWRILTEIRGHLVKLGEHSQAERCSLCG